MKAALVALIALASSCGILRPAFAAPPVFPQIYPAHLVLYPYTKFTVTDTGRWVYTAPYQSAVFEVQILPYQGTSSATLIITTSATTTGEPTGSYHGTAVETILLSGRYVVNNLGPWTKIRINAENGATVSVQSVFRATPSATVMDANVKGTVTVMPTGAGISTSGYEITTTGWAVDVFTALPANVTHALVYNRATSASVFLGGANVTSTLYSIPLVQVGNTDGPTAFVADNSAKFSLYAVSIMGTSVTLGVLGW